MDLEEYLLAKNENNLINLIKNSYDKNVHLDSLFDERAINYYKEYLYIGGMPRVVENFIMNNNYEMARIERLNILEAYQNDMSKYNKNLKFQKPKLYIKI